jgi:hypothetical protein
MDSEDIVRKFHQKRGRIRDPGSGKNPSRIRIPDPGGKKAPDPGSGSAILDGTFINFLSRGFLSNNENINNIP